jgi:hypothetical protein
VHFVGVILAVGRFIANLLGWKAGLLPALKYALVLISWTGPWLRVHAAHLRPLVASVRAVDLHVASQVFAGDALSIGTHEISLRRALSIGIEAAGFVESVLAVLDSIAN